MTVCTESKRVEAEYNEHVRGGFTPLPVAISKAHNATLWDVDGNKYIDFLSFFAVANMGHAHPKIVAAACKATQECPLANTAVMSPSYAKLGSKIQEVLGYENIVCMCSGADVTDTASKIARKWGYIKKGIPENEAFILTTTDCYHGITISTHSMSYSKDKNFAPFVPKVGPISPSGIVVEYGDIESLSKALAADHETIAAFMVEPIQGSAGCIEPPKEYFKQAYNLCKKYNVLFVDDEVQAGLGRAGYPLCSWQYGVKPDLVCLGKALGGGVATISAVIGHPDVMDTIDGGEIGSTMAANPPATEAAIAALEVMVEEDICEKSLNTGKLMRSLIMEACCPEIVSVSGTGTLGAAVLNPEMISDKFNGQRLAALCTTKGLIVTSSRGGLRVRVCPPPTISEDDLKAGVKILASCVKTLSSIEGPILGVN